MRKFLILKSGAVLEKRLLRRKGKDNGRDDVWTDSAHALEFSSLQEAEQEAAQHENVRILWTEGQDWGDVT
jgi:hypothetical protein